MANLRRIFLFVASIALVLTSTGCISNSVPRARLAGVQKIGVVIATDQAMHAICVGTTVFNNEKWDAPEVPLDTHRWIREEFQAADPALFKIFENTPKTAGVLANSYQPSFLVPARPSAEELKRFGATEGVQLVVVLTSGQAGDFMGQTSASLPCHGYYHRSIFGMHFDFAYFTSEVRVFDARDGEAISDSSAIGFGTLKDMAWEKSWVELSPANQAAVKEKVEASTHAAIATKIKELELAAHP